MKCQNGRLRNKCDLPLAIRMLKKLHEEMNIVSSAQCSYYAKLCNKCKNTGDINNYVMKYGIPSHTLKGNDKIQEVSLKCCLCEEYVKGNTTIKTVGPIRKSKQINHEGNR